jgi:hypothetical protein
MIPPAAQRSMARRAGATIAEEAGSHAIYVSRPERVAAVIEHLAESVA